MLPPKLLHLNADTSWLLSLPLPSGEYYNILLDPWLTGSQTDVSRLISTQWHVTASCVSHVSEINDRIDVIVICHEFTDHMHKETLLQCNKLTPVFATKTAASMIKSWKHFNSVNVIPRMVSGQSWKKGSHSGLPPTIGILQVAPPKRELVPFFHSGLCFAYREGKGEKPEPESDGSVSAIVYTPHGLPFEVLDNLLPSAGITQTTALMHGLEEATVLGSKFTLGARNDLAAVRNTKARWWIGTHDEPKKGVGIIHKVIKKKRWTVAEALKEDKGIGSDVKYVELGSGESVILD